MANKPNKTNPTANSVEAFLATVTPDSRCEDSFVLLELMTRVSGESARMWGPSIGGFGVRRYRYDSGREGEVRRIGFSPRKPAMVLYVAESTTGDPLVARLGKISTGKPCIYVKRLADIDLSLLRALIVRTFKSAQRAPLLRRRRRSAECAGGPELGEGLDQPGDVRVGMHGRGGDTQAFQAAGDGGIVDGLDIDAIVVQQPVAEHLALGCVTDHHRDDVAFILQARNADGRQLPAHPRHAILVAGPLEGALFQVLDAGQGAGGDGGG